MTTTSIPSSSKTRDGNGVTRLKANARARRSWNRRFGRRHSLVCRSRRDADVDAALSFFALDRAREVTLEDIKKRYRERMFVNHPDRAKTKEEKTFRERACVETRERYDVLVAAFATKTNDEVLAHDFTTIHGETSAFDFECDVSSFDGASEVYVDAFACLGATCEEACATTCAERFEWVSNGRLARYRCELGERTESEEHAVWLASQRCPRKCIHYVTKAQREALEALANFAASDDGASDVTDAIASSVLGLLAKANRENARAEGAMKARDAKSTGDDVANT